MHDGGWGVGVWQGTGGGWSKSGRVRMDMAEGRKGGSRQGSVFKSGGVRKCGGINQGRRER